MALPLKDLQPIYLAFDLPLAGGKQRIFDRFPVQAQPFDKTQEFWNLTCLGFLCPREQSGLVALREDLAKAVPLQSTDDYREADRWLGQIDTGFALKQVVNGVRSRQGGRDLVGRSKGGTDIATSVPGNLRMIFEVQLVGHSVEH